MKILRKNNNNKKKTLPLYVFPYLFFLHFTPPCITIPYYYQNMQLRKTTDSVTTLFTSPGTNSTPICCLQHLKNKLACFICLPNYQVLFLKTDCPQLGKYFHQNHKSSGRTQQSTSEAHSACSRLFSTDPLILALEICYEADQQSFLHYLDWQTQRSQCLIDIKHLMQEQKLCPGRQELNYLYKLRGTVNPRRDLLMLSYIYFSELFVNSWHI